jgi:hypothetical protein
MMNPAFLFATAPGDVGPVTFAFDYLDAGSLFEAIADFTIGFQVNSVGFIQQ